MSRKVIGLLTAAPESVFATRLIDGLCARCSSYGYDVAVFSSLAPVSFAQEKYLAGEMNIYNLVNFDQLDGVVIDGPSLMDSRTFALPPQITSLLREKCRKPVAAIGYPLEDYPCFTANDRPVFQQITEHVIDQHHCRKLYFLAGQQDNPDSLCRLNGFRDALAARDIPFDESCVFYGDFWYSGGTSLAKRLLSGEVPMPQAIICASDHMAIGLTNRLTEHGVRVPEDIVITGFDATHEAAINQVTITSVAPDCDTVAAQAIDSLRRRMEPGQPLAPYHHDAGKFIRMGMSCGCNQNMTQVLDVMRESFYNTKHDFSTGSTKVDIGLLIESNMTEYLSDTTSPQDCIRQIYNFSYLMDYYDDFYLCLDENWLNPDLCCKSGYPAQIKNVIHNTNDIGTGHFSGGPVFSSACMLPELGDDTRPASIFFFMPVHFLDQSMGYAVLRYQLDGTHRITCVIRNWLKNVNVGLHISRTTSRLESLSSRDGMTGAYNRRGMELMLDQMLRRAAPEDSVLAFVIDMDRLKQINDSFGHPDGDACIKAICSACMRITREDELCVRAGGDEFYIIGIGNYSADQGEERIRLFQQYLNEFSTLMDKPYALSASIGSACIPLSSGMTVMGIIRIADAKMYENKVQKKLQRKD